MDLLLIIDFYIHYVVVRVKSVGQYIQILLFYYNENALNRIRICQTAS